jgi:NAD-dependent deacetylase
MNEIKEAAKVIALTHTGVAFTGAGISAESGISTYRDSGGLWDRYQEGASGGFLGVLASHPEEAPEILRGFVDRLIHAKPNPGHVSLAELEKMGYIGTVVTQNVDNLHREAGNSKVYELHGNMFRLRCLGCGQKKNIGKEALRALMMPMIEELRKSDLSKLINLLPECEKCRNKMRPDFVSFGEPVQLLDDAISAVSACDLMLIIGTSGVVYPAASLPMMARSRGARVIEINPQKSDMTHLADIFLQGTAANVLPELVAALKEY